MEEESCEKLANYIQETIKDAATLTDLGMLSSPTASQNLTLGQDEDSHDLSLSPHTDGALHNSHTDTPPITTSQRHFGVVNTLSPPVRTSQNRLPQLTTSRPDQTNGHGHTLPTSRDFPPTFGTLPPVGHDMGVPTVPPPMDTGALNAFFQWQIQKDREDRRESEQKERADRQERDREAQRQESRWHDILTQQQTLHKQSTVSTTTSAIRPMRDDVDISQYIVQFEQTLEDNEVDRAKWKKIIVNKLNTKAEQRCKTFLNDPLCSYDDLKSALLQTLGPTLDELSNYVHGVVPPPFKGKSATDRLQTQIRHVERLLYGADDHVLRYSAAYFKAHCERKYAHKVRIDKIQSFNDLYSVAASIDSEVAHDKARAQTQPQSRRRDYSSVTCFFCGKQGHIESECYKKKNSLAKEQPTRKDTNTYKDHKAKNNSDRPPNRDGHYNSYKQGSRQQNDTGIKARPYVVNWGVINDSRCVVPGRINDHVVDMTIDTGAQITIVPGIYVYTDNLTGDSVPILGVNGDPVDYQLATVPITVKDKTVMERVAVAPANQLNARVLLAVPLDTNKANNLLDAWINKATTPPQGEDSVQQQTQALAARILPARAAKQNITYYKNTSDESDNEVYEDDRASDLSFETEDTDTETSVTSDSPDLQEVTDKHDNLADNIPPQNSVTPTTVVAHDKETSHPIISLTSDQSSDNKDAVNTGITTDDSQTDPNMDKQDGVIGSPDTSQFLPPLLLDTDSSSLLQFKKLIKSDQTLHTIRGLAHHEKNGYYWQDGLIFHNVTDETHGIRKRLVIPQTYRPNIIAMAHDKTGHFCKTRTCSYINTRFTWPHLTTNVTDYILACKKCKAYNKQAHKPAPLTYRPMITEPHDEVAMDIIGPLPRAKGGYRFALTTICMASRWPDVFPLAKPDASHVAQALVQSFSRNGIPSKLLSDQGAQFMSSTIKELCRICGITQIHTVPYRPQGNGVLERLHGTLKPILAKAAADGLDWLAVLPLALSAVRFIPNGSTGFSPAEVVYGRNPRSILDVLYEGWTNPDYSPIDTSKWIIALNDQLEVLRDSAALQNHLNKRKQNQKVNSRRKTRVYNPNDKVFVRIPGTRAALQASWEGPFSVVKHIPPLNYEVRDDSNTWTRTVHLNNIRSFKPASFIPPSNSLVVQAANVVAEETLEMSHVLEPVQTEYAHCPDFDQAQIDAFKKNNQDSLAVIPRTAKVEPHTIKLAPDAKPSSKPPYQVPIHLRPKVNAELDKLIEQGIIEPSDDTTWCAPLVPVRKPDGSIRLCVDFRELNQVRPLDRHMIPTLPSILDSVGKASVLSKIDLTSGFHQIPLDPEVKNLTTFLTPKGKFRFLKMPFGLKNAPSHFQRVMERVLQPVSSFAAVYIDDIIVFSDSWTQHLQHLEAVFQCFREAGLTAKPSKCSFGMTSLEYLGHKIGSGTMAVPQHRATALANFKQPITKKGLRSFLGSASYYRKFIKNFADMSSKLTPLTSVSSPKHVVWTDERLDAFDQLKVSLCTHTTLTIPSPSDSYSLHTDASGSGVGACLHVIRDGAELPVAFFSRQLQGAEKRYSVTELESLAIVAAIKHFDFYLYGTSFEVITDHKACTALLTSRALNTRLRRMALFLQDRDIAITFRAGKLSGNADGFSRQFEDFTIPTEQETPPSSGISPPQVSSAGGCGGRAASGREPHTHTSTTL